MNLKTIAAAILLATVVTGTPAWAHHSFAMFDMNKQVVLEGTVKEFQWTAPHSWVQLMVPGPDGKEVEWSIEWRSPNQLLRTGVKKTVFKPGDKVQITINPMRNGAPGGSLAKARLADGTIVGQPIGERAPVQQLPTDASSGAKP